MATPQTFTLNQFNASQLIVTAPDASGNSGLVIVYDVADASGQFKRTGQTKTLALTAQQQNQVNAFWAGAIAAGKASEGIA